MPGNRVLWRGFATDLHNPAVRVTSHRYNALDTLLPRNPVPVWQDSDALAEKEINRPSAHAVDRAGYFPDFQFCGRLPLRFASCALKSSWQRF